MSRRVGKWLSWASACLLFTACGPLEEPGDAGDAAESLEGSEVSASRDGHGPSDPRCSEPVLVADLTPPPGHSSIFGHAEVDGAVFISVIDGARGTFSLWRLEESGGREPAWDAVLLLGGLTEEPRPLIALGRRLLFTLDDGIHGRELWTSDGTPAGTRLLEDINPGSASAFPDTPLELLRVGRTVYFAADDGTHGRELWKSDGTRPGTRLVEDIADGPASSDPGPLVADDHRLLFAADDGVHGRELWKSDGTRSGTRLVEDIARGAASSSPTRFVRVDGEGTFFIADDGVHGGELWKSDGTRRGTKLVEDIRPGPEGSDIGAMVAAKGRLYFTADDGEHGTEPWVSKGCEDDTRLVEDIRPGSEGSAPMELTPLGRKLVFTADDGRHGREPWRSDGTPGGTRLLEDITPGPAPGFGPPTMLTAADGRVFFYADDTVTGYEPWVTDGTPGGTHLVKDIRPGPGNSISGDPDPIFPVRDGVVAFRAFVPELGSELWWTDGTRSGTRRVDIAPGPDSSSPADLFVAGRWVYFTARDDRTGGGEPRALPLACFTSRADRDSR